MRHLVLGALLGLAACAPPPEAPEPVSGDVPEGSDAPWENARQRGVTFRAVGNEPGWHVEVFADSLVFTADYGETVYRFADYETTADGEADVYRAHADGNTLTVTRTPTRCIDGMSGKPFEATVAVTFDGQSYRGCGRVLE